MMHPKLRFRGEEFLLIGSREHGGAIATDAEYENFEVSSFHLCRNGDIMRFGHIVGHAREIEWLDIDVMEAHP